MVALVQVAALVIAAVPMALALAHALEYPGKLRLDREQYAATQGIYYPGFTLAGAFEPLTTIATLVLLAMTPAGTTAFWLILAAAAASVATQAVYWLRTAPVNKAWAKSAAVTGAAQRLFEAAGALRGPDDWTVLRDRWERSHQWRALTAATAFVLLVIAIVTG